MKALDKCPGVTPIGVGAVSDRLSTKVMIYITGGDAPLECSLMDKHSLIDEEAQDGCEFLLMDAVSTFNSLSKLAAIWNTRVRCFCVDFNSYCGYSLQGRSKPY